MITTLWLNMEYSYIFCYISCSFCVWIPIYPLLYNVACMLAFMGNPVLTIIIVVNMVWKTILHYDFSYYFGIWALINMYYQRSSRRNNLNRYNTLFMYVFLISNTLVKYDILFPSVYGVYVGGSLF